MIVLDASVLIAHLDATDFHHERAGALLRAAADEVLGASPITLAEVLVGPARAMPGSSHRRYEDPPMTDAAPDAMRASPRVHGAMPFLSPACQGLLGRAEGLAAAAGMQRVASEHGVLAWLWEDSGHAVTELETFGTTATALCDALVTRAVVVPAAPLPEPDRRSWGERIYFPLDRLENVLAQLNRELPPGDWGWNHDGERAWATAVASLDLSNVLDQALRGLNRP